MNPLEQLAAEAATECVHGAIDGLALFGIAPEVTLSAFEAAVQALRQQGRPN